jgi:Calcineurin-like phosphoesterase
MLTRRRFIALSGSVAGALTLQRLHAAGDVATLPAIEDGVSFFLVGDTHYLAKQKKPDELDSVSREYSSRLIEWLNRLPGSELIGSVGRGRLPAPSGLIHAGDLIDSGNATGGSFETMQQTEFKAWSADFGLNGGDGKLPFAVREVHGNHDAPNGYGLVLDGIRERNKTRAGVNVASNGVHYSWDWGGVHFVNLGIVVGQTKEPARPRRYPPLESLEFLIGDLAERVGQSGRPVVITHHVDVARYCVPDDRPQRGAKNEWDFTDVQAYYEAIRRYRVAAILYGHTHERRIFAWDGRPPVGDGVAGGIPVFNTDNVSHFKWEEQAFLHFQITATEIVAREFSSPDGWKTGEWTPEVWRFPLKT